MQGGNEVILKAARRAARLHPSMIQPAGAAPAHVKVQGAATGRRLRRSVGRPATKPLAAGLAHDARNLLSAINLYCDLLAEPGVLAPAFRHYAGDLLCVGQAGARLIEKMAVLRSADGPIGRQTPSAVVVPECEPISDLGRELLEARSLLAAIAGPAVRIEVECLPCSGELRIGREELLRVLVNLVRNAAEAQAGFIRITAQRGGGANFTAGTVLAANTVVLAVQDNGLGIPAEHLARIFDAGFTTKAADNTGARDHPDDRGLGLAIVRRLAEQAGGRVRAVSPPGWGARIEIELPLTAGGMGTVETAWQSALSRKALQGTWQAEVQPGISELEKKGRRLDKSPGLNRAARLLKKTLTD